MENDWSVDIESVISGIAPRSTTATSSSNVGSYPITTNISSLSATVIKPTIIIYIIMCKS